MHPQNRKVPIDVYNCKNNTWKDRIMINPEDSHTLECCDIAALNGFIYLAGSSTFSYSAILSFRRYSIKTKECVLLKPMNRMRELFKLIALNNHFYAIGGHDKSVERYDPEKDIWEFVSSRNSSGCPHSAVVHNGMIYVLNDDSFEYYDPKKNFWFPLNDSPSNTSFIHSFQLISFDNC